MKFVNKLSVISLIVLMFSFMNVAGAVSATGASGDMNGDGNNNSSSGLPTCPDYKETSCDRFNHMNKITDEKKVSMCNSSYIRKGAQSAVTCKWTGNLEAVKDKVMGKKVTTQVGQCEETKTACAVRLQPGSSQ